MKSVYAFGFYVPLSECAFSSLHKYSSNYLKLIYVFQVYYRMFHIESGIDGTNGSCTKPHKKISVQHSQKAKFFKSAF